MHPWVLALLGGALIGLSASLLLLFNGRVAGISTIAGGLLGRPSSETSWRVAFLFGLLLGGAVLAVRAPEVFGGGSKLPLPVLIAGGLLIGFGTRLGSGCTSGHGVCGIARGSTRSIAATVVFMLAGMAMVALARRLLGVVP
jgi:uncharacterized membrane protein YedE/YeeE